MQESTPLLRKDRVTEVIRLTQSITKDGRRLPVSASFNGRIVPAGNVVEASDFVLLHGNGVTDPAYITTIVEKTQHSYRLCLIVRASARDSGLRFLANLFISEIQSTS